MCLVALGASLANTVMLFDSSGNFGPFDLLSLFRFERWIILQLSSTARAIVKSKLPEVIDLIFEGVRSCRLCPGWPPCFRCFPVFGAVFLSYLVGLTMSEEGGLGELEEFFNALASFSSSFWRRFSRSAILALDSLHPGHCCWRDAMMKGK